MTELQLYKFIEKHAFQYKKTNDTEFIVWLYFDALNNFCKILGSNYLSRSGENLVLMDGYVAVNIFNICEHFEVDIEKQST